MPSFIVKPDPAVDLYCEWSTVVDNLTSVGTRTDYPPDRLARADATGTSAHDFSEYGWDDKKFIVTNTERSDAGFFWLNRTDLLAYARAMAADDTATAEALLAPIPDEDDDTI